MNNQVNDLREVAGKFEGYQNGEISRMLREAAETIQRQQERIAELERSLEHYRLEVICYENDVDARDALICDLWAGIVREYPQGGFPDMGLMEKRMRELGIEVER